MRYDETEKLKDTEFCGLTGVKRKTFDAMIKILKAAEAATRRKGGHKSKLSALDMLLPSLEYLREYRTYFHIVQEFGILETHALRVSRWVEETLIKDSAFSLPGRKMLTKSDVEYEVILIDATETSVERSKRGKNFGVPERKNDTR